MIPILSDVQDFDAHERQRNALLMLKLMVQGEADVQPGRTASQLVAEPRPPCPPEPDRAQ